MGVRIKGELHEAWLLTQSLGEPGSLQPTPIPGRCSPQLPPPTEPGHSSQGRGDMHTLVVPALGPLNEIEAKYRTEMYKCAVEGR